MTTLHPSEFLTRCTVRLETKLKNDRIGIGTGFLYDFWAPDRQGVCRSIVTNRHVVEGSTAIRFFLSLADDQGTPLPLQKRGVLITGGDTSWYPHPDPECDLAMIPFRPILDQAEAEGVRLSETSLNHTLLPSDEEAQDLGAIEDIVMIGYPDGLWDDANNLPVVRRGITATHPNVDFQGKKEFLVDIAVYHGSSGSPIFLYNMGSARRKRGAMTMGVIEVKLLGVLCAGILHSDHGTATRVLVSDDTSSPSDPNRQIINLGVVIKGSRITELGQVIQAE